MHRPQLYLVQTLLCIIPATRRDRRAIPIQQHRKPPGGRRHMRLGQICLQITSVFRPRVTRYNTPTGTCAVCIGSTCIGTGVEVLDLDTLEVLGLALAVVESAKEAELFP